MRFVNLRKRNTSKFQYVAKKLTKISMFCLAIAAVVVVPLTANAYDAQAESQNDNNIIEVDNDYLGTDMVDVLDHMQ